jgi:hypothetical protein
MGTATAVRSARALAALTQRRFATLPRAASPIVVIPMAAVQRAMTNRIAQKPPPRANASYRFAGQCSAKTPRETAIVPAACATRAIASRSSSTPVEVAARRAPVAVAAAKQARAAASRTPAAATASRIRRRSSATASAIPSSTPSSAPRTAPPRKLRGTQPESASGPSDPGEPPRPPQRPPRRPNRPPGALGAHFLGDVPDATTKLRR